MKKLLIALLSISILSAAACSDGTDDGDKKGKTDPPGSAAIDYSKREAAAKKVSEDDKAVIKEVATTYSDIGHKGYSGAVEGAKALKAAIDELVTAAEAVKKNPDLDSNKADKQVVALKAAVTKAQDAWKASRPAYLQTEVYRFYGGPINQYNPYYNDEMSDEAEIEPLVNAWPIDESYIDYTCLYSGVPKIDGSPVEEEGYHCDPSHMTPIANCKEAAGESALTSFVDEQIPVLPSTATAEETAKRNVLVEQLKAKIKNNDCYVPKERVTSSPKKWYSFTNMTSYAVSIIGGSNGAFLDISGGKKYSALTDDEKKALQLKIRDLGGGNPIAGQSYGRGEDKDPCTKEEIALNDPKCHHVSQSTANVSTGYHAIEFVLWGQDFNPNGAGTRPYADYAPNITDAQYPAEIKKAAKRRLVYLQATVDMLINDLEYVQGQWAETPDAAYKTKFKQNGNNYRAQFMGWADSEPLSLVRKVFTGMHELSVNETGGERIQPALELQNQEEEHSCFSDNTQVDMQMDIQGIVNVFNGTYVPTVTCDALKCTGTVDTVGKGMKDVLALYVGLCKDEHFSGDENCKGDKVPSVAKLGAGLDKALDDAKNLLGTREGEKYFDQEVFKVWPPTLDSQQEGAEVTNPGREKLQKLADALSALDPLYGAFSTVLGVKPAEEQAQE